MANRYKPNRVIVLEPHETLEVRFSQQQVPPMVIHWEDGTKMHRFDEVVAAMRSSQEALAMAQARLMPQKG